MKRMALMAALVLAGGMIGACDHKDSVAQYNPQLDGMLPHPAVPPNETIMENQRKIYDTMVAANGGIRPSTAAPAPSGAATPATTAPGAAPAGGAATPQGEGAPAAPAPSGEGAAPLPPTQ